MTVYQQTSYLTCTPEVTQHAACMQSTWPFTSLVQNRTCTHEQLPSTNHIQTHVHTPAEHTSPLLVGAQTPHASAPRSLSHRPQHLKKKQMDTSWLDGSPEHTATVLHHTNRCTHMHEELNSLKLSNCSPAYVF